MNYTVTPMVAAHIPALARIEKACFAAPWSEAALLEELNNPVSHFLVAEADGVAVGYVGLQVVGDEGFFTNIAVSPTCRRQGVADTLMTALSELGKKQALFRLTLEVRVGNAAAIALYEKHGYVKDGVRPGFYRNPTEDAAIYSLYY